MSLPPPPYTGGVSAFEWESITYTSAAHLASVAGSGYSIGTHSYSLCPLDEGLGGIAAINAAAGMSETFPDLLNDPFFAGDGVLTVSITVALYLPPGETGVCNFCGGNNSCTFFEAAAAIALTADGAPVALPYTHSYTVGVDTLPVFSFAVTGSFSSIYPMASLAVKGAPAPVDPPDPPPPPPPPTLVPLFRPCRGSQAVVAGGPSSSGAVQV